MNRSFRNKLIILVLSLLMAFGMTTPVAAEGLITGDTIPAGMVYEHDAILIGQNVVIDGTVNGNVFILGNQVTINGKVDGSLILLGQNAAISGVVAGGVYGVLLTLELAPEASIGRDLYVAAISLTSGPASVIGRDLFALGLDSGLNGQVGRDLHTVIGPIQLYNGLMTLLGYDNLTIKLHFEIPQNTSAPSGSLLSPLRRANEHRVTQNMVSVYRPLAAPAAPFDWGKWALALLRNWAVLLLFGLLAFWLGRKGLQRSGQALQAHPWRALGTGFVVLVISLASVGAALLVGVIIFAIGLGLNYVGIWPLTIALWALAYACMAVAMVALWLFIVYGTKIIAFYFVAQWAFGRLFERKNVWMDLLALLAGSVVYALLRSIPYVGWIFDLLVTALGAGAAWMALRGPARQPLPELKPVEAVEPLQPVEPLPTLQPVQPEPVILPAPPKPVKVASRKKTVPLEETPPLKITRKKAKPVEPLS